MALTANTTPAYYTASASSNNSTAFQAFDQSNATSWSPSTNGATEFIKLDLGIDYVINSIALMCNATFGLTSFTLAGSQNDSSYTTITTQSGLSGWANGSYNTYTFSNTTFYEYYRITCTGQPASPVQIVEIQFIKTDTNGLTLDTGSFLSFDTGSSTLSNLALNYYTAYPGSFNALSSVTYNTPREGLLFPPLTPN